MNYGQLKIWTNRIRNNIGILQAFIIFALGYDRFGFSWYYIPIGLTFILFSIFDNTKGFEQEIGYVNRKNKMFMEIHKKIMEQK